jgi:polyhydroxybutyrate depolymerase
LATEDDPTAVLRHTYGGGAGGTEVIFYLVEGGGHTWPGRYQYASTITVGPTTQRIDGTEYIWRHLREHRLPEGER